MIDGYDEYKNHQDELRELADLKTQLAKMTKDRDYFHDLNEEIIDMMKGKDLRIRALEKEVKRLEDTDRNNNIIIKTAAERIESLKETLAVDQSRLADAVEQIKMLEEAGLERKEKTE